MGILMLLSIPGEFVSWISRTDSIPDEKVRIYVDNGVNAPGANETAIFLQNGSKYSLDSTPLINSTGYGGGGLWRFYFDYVADEDLDVLPEVNSTQSFGADGGNVFVEFNKTTSSYGTSNLTYFEACLAFFPEDDVGTAGADTFAFKLHFEPHSSSSVLDLGEAAVQILFLVYSDDESHVWSYTVATFKKGDRIPQEEDDWFVVPFSLLKKPSWGGSGYPDVYDGRALSSVKFVIGFMPSGSYQPSYSFRLEVAQIALIRYPYLEDFSTWESISHFSPSVYPDSLLHEMETEISPEGYTTPCSLKVEYRARGSTSAYFSSTLASTGANWPGAWSQWSDEYGAAIGAFPLSSYDGISFAYRFTEVSVPEGLQNYYFTVSILVDADFDGYDSSDGDEVFSYTFPVMEKTDWLEVFLPYELFEDADWDNGKGDNGTDFTGTLEEFLEKYPEMGSKGIGITFTISIPPLEDGQEVGFVYLLDDIKFSKRVEVFSTGEKMGLPHCYPSVVMPGEKVHLVNIPSSADVKLISVDGMLIKDVEGDSCVMDDGAGEPLPPGVYFFVVISNGGRRFLKVVVK